MIGSGLKKLAKELGMQVDSGVAYGNIRGYNSTFCEGNGWKRIDISTHFADPEQRNGLQRETNAVDMQRLYRVQELTIHPKTISVIFLDNPGTMKKLREFIDWFYPLLGKYNAARENVCPECGGELFNGAWYLIDGVAHCMHEACASRVQAQLDQTEQQRQEEDTGSYAQGFVGALFGAILGAVVWALVLMWGYMASIVGLLIGWLADKGYKLFKGKQGKGKVAILIVVVILGVLLGTLAADAVALAQMISSGELLNITYGEIPSAILFMLATESEYLMATLGNIGMGLLFAGLGVYALLRKAGQEVSGVKMKKLN